MNSEQEKLRPHAKHLFPGDSQRDSATEITLCLSLQQVWFSSHFLKRHCLASMNQVF